MPFLSAVSTALPPYLFEQPAVKAFAAHHFAEAIPQIERYLPIFDHAQIDTRFMVKPLEWFTERHTFGECNEIFYEWAVRLGQEVAQRCLDNAGISPQQVDHIIFVSTTGLATPSIDAHLINTMNMGKHTRRSPIWGLGCAGGVAGLARAYEYTRAYPQHRALLVNVELCSITFQWNDLSKRNFVAASLFADGAAAVLVEGDEVAQSLDNERPRPPRILGTQSTLWPNSIRTMGWDIVDSGMRVVFSARIPAVVQELMYDNVMTFLAPFGLDLKDIDRFILHPGGAKVVRAYEQALGLAPEQVCATREILRRHGNMSSATVFFVLAEVLRDAPLEEGQYGLLGVLGPGFSCELALIQG